MKVKLPHQNRIVDRRELICKAIKGTSVLHIGCTDSPYTKERAESDHLLHQALQKSARYLAGIDVNREDIEIMKKYGIKNLFFCDIYHINNNTLPNIKFDHIVLSEVLEHLPNAGLALKELRSFIDRNNKKAH